MCLFLGLVEANSGISDQLFGRREALAGSLAASRSIAWRRLFFFFFSGLWAIPSMLASEPTV